MILVTGSSSLLGKNLIKKLIAEGKEVRGFDETADKEFPKNIEFIQGNVLNRALLKKACNGVDTIIHLQDVKKSSHKGRGYMKKINIKGTENLLFEAKLSKIKNFIFLSSYTVYGKYKDAPHRENAILKPMTPYGRDKMRAERSCNFFSKKHGLNTTIVRPAITLGKETADSTLLITLYMGMAMDKDNRLYISQNEENRLQTLSIDDATNAITAILKDPLTSMGKIYNIGANESLAQKEIVKIFEETSGVSFEIKPLTPFKGNMMYFISKIVRLNYFSKEYRYCINNTIELDSDEIRTDLGWEPKDTNEAIIKEIVLWYKNTKLK